MLKKLFVAMIPMTIALAITGGAPRAEPQPPAIDTEPQIGGCRYFCGNDPTQHKTRAACEAVCSTVCEPVC